MAEFDADKLAKRLEELNRQQLATLERLSEELLREMERKGPIRADPERRDAGARGDASGAARPQRAEPVSQRRRQRRTR